MKVELTTVKLESVQIFWCINTVSSDSECRV